MLEVAYALIGIVYPLFEGVDFLAQLRPPCLIACGFPLVFQLTQPRGHRVETLGCICGVLLGGVHHLGHMPLQHIDLLRLGAVVLAFQLQTAHLLTESCDSLAHIFDGGGLYIDYLFQFNSHICLFFK